MKLFKLTFLTMALVFLPSCAISSQDQTLIMLINSDPISAGCKLKRLNDYALPDLPDVSILPANDEEDIALIDALIEHISVLRGDINELKSDVCNNY